jgi:hypothetical protein
VARNDKLEFLADVVPKTTTYKKVKEARAKESCETKKTLEANGQAPLEEEDEGVESAKDKGEMGSDVEMNEEDKARTIETEDMVIDSDPEDAGAHGDSEEPADEEKRDSKRGHLDVETRGSRRTSGRLSGRGRNIGRGADEGE